MSTRSSVNDFAVSSKLITQDTYQEFAQDLEASFQILCNCEKSDPLAASQTLVRFILIKWYEENLGNYTISSRTDSRALLRNLNEGLKKSIKWYQQQFGQMNNRALVIVSAT